jgi:hypothetical protein
MPLPALFGLARSGNIGGYPISRDRYICYLAKAVTAAALRDKPAVPPPASRAVICRAKGL